MQQPLLSDMAQAHVQVVAQKLWPAYMQPVREGSARLDEHSKLHSALAPLLRSQGARLAAAGTAGLSLPLKLPALITSKSGPSSPLLHKRYLLCAPVAYCHWTECQQDDSMLALSKNMASSL